MLFQACAKKYEAKPAQMSHAPLFPRENGFVPQGELNPCLTISTLGAEMKLSNKARLATLALVALLVTLGQLPTAHSDPPPPQTLEANALACLTDVYPVDLNHYNVTLDACYTLSAPSDKSTTQAVNYMLNSPDSNLVADFLFKDAALYQLSLSVINGSIVTARPYTNLTDAAADILAKYQAFSGADSTKLTHLLGKLDEAKGATVTSGNISLSVSHLVIPNAENGSTFDWLYTLDGANSTSVSLTFDNGAFSSLFDCRQLYTAGSAEAISAAIKYIENYSYTAPDSTLVSEFNVNKNGTVAEFSTSLRNDNALYPCWNVTLKLDQAYPGGVNALLLQVWADSGEVFNCQNQAVDPVQVNHSNMDSTPIATAAAVALVAIAAVIIAMRRQK
jgi:hypothetical protein